MIDRKFRYDINGLRALAVIAVVLFHFKIPGFSGGFVGVDVFFVISGFLMTGIIVRGLEASPAKGFRLFDFYMARLRRIVPALAVVCIVLLLAGWLFLAPADYVKLAREVDRALLFISNNYYFKNSGYFDADSHERMLLHSWSLSVEWQFYMIYPLVLMLVARLGTRFLPYVIGALLLVSFGVSCAKSYSDANYAFYLLPSRAWEMFVGGLVFYFSRQGFMSERRKYLYFPGLICIALAIFLFDGQTIWPGLPAALPVLGTALIIFANHDCISSRNQVVQRLGDWSYSIYLWHWPLVVALVLLNLQGNPILSLPLIGLSLLLGWVSYALVENPLRKFLTRFANWKVLLGTLLIIALVLSGAEKIRKAKGFIQRIPDEVHEIFSAEFDRFSEMDKCHEKRAKGGPDCFYGEDDQVSAIIMGDSHAMSLVPVIADFYRSRNERVLDWSIAGCPTLQNVKLLDADGALCMEFLAKTFSEVNHYPGVPILLSNRYSASLQGANEANASKVPGLYFEKIYTEFSEAYTAEVYSHYKNGICKLAETNPVYIFRPVPELRVHVPRAMGRALLYRGENVRVSITKTEYEERNYWANTLLNDVRDHCGVQIIELVDTFCDQTACYGDNEGTPLYFDDDHLNVFGANTLLKLLEKNLGAVN